MIRPNNRLSDDDLRDLGIEPPAREPPLEAFVATLAAHVLPALGFRIQQSRYRHPDLICEWRGAVVGVELESSVENYNKHQHDGADAHVVACWSMPEHDLVEGGYVHAARCTAGYSSRLAVVSLRDVALHGDPHAVGAKRPAPPVPRGRKGRERTRVVMIPFAGSDYQAVIVYARKHGFDSLCEAIRSTAITAARRDREAELPDECFALPTTHIAPARAVGLPDSDVFRRRRNDLPDPFDPFDR